MESVGETPGSIPLPDLASAEIANRNPGLNGGWGRGTAETEEKLVGFHCGKRSRHVHCRLVTGGSGHLLSSCSGTREHGTGKGKAKGSRCHSNVFGLGTP